MVVWAIPKISLTPVMQMRLQTLAVVIQAGVLEVLVVVAMLLRVAQDKVRLQTILVASLLARAALVCRKRNCSLKIMSSEVRLAAVRMALHVNARSRQALMGLQTPRW
jgi:hypothetical protein